MTELTSFTTDLINLFSNHWSLLLSVLFYMYVSNRIIDNELIVKRVRILALISLITKEGTHIKDVITRDELLWFESVKNRYNILHQNSKIPVELRKTLNENIISKGLPKTRFRIIPAISFPFLLPVMIRQNIEYNRLETIHNKINS